MLGGVTFDHPRGLAGHSDGDVIAHALIDALLGAAGLGDIGSLFPSGDERWRGADSLDLLRDAYAQVREAGCARQRRLRPDRRGAADRPAPRGDAPPARRRARRRAGARERPRDDDRPARLHRPRRRPRGRRPSRCLSADEARPLRRPARPARAALAALGDVPGVHAPQRARATSTGAASTSDFPDFQVALSTATSWSRRRTRCRSPGTGRSTICPPAGTRDSSAE